MNKNGQIGMGVLLGIFIAVVVVVALLPAIASNVETGTQENTGVSTVSQGQYTGILNTNVELIGQELVGTPTVVNRTDGVTIPAANYTIGECVRASDSLKGICFKATSAAGAGSAVKAVNISYTYYPEGYIDDGAGRTIITLVIVLGAIALLVFVLVPVIKGLEILH